MKVGRKPMLALCCGDFQTPRRGRQDRNLPPSIGNRVSAALLQRRDLGEPLPPTRG